MVTLPMTPSDFKGQFSNRKLVSWSLTSLFSTNMAISETNLATANPAWQCLDKFSTNLSIISLIKEVMYIINNYTCTKVPTGWCMLSSFCYLQSKQMANQKQFINNELQDNRNITFTFTKQVLIFQSQNK